MLPYLITFSASFFLYKCALKPVSKKLRFACLLLCALIPSFFAGLRDETLGWDWAGYGVTIWNLATHTDSFSRLLSFFPAIESGYKLINYVVAAISHDCHVFFFFHQLILISIAIAIAYMNREYRNSEIILLFYFFYLYNPSFTMLRQAVAMMISFLAFAVWVRQYNKCSYVLSAVAGLFHFSAIFAFFAYILLKFKHFLTKYMVFVLLISVAVFVAYHTILTGQVYSQLMTKLIASNIISGHYGGYIDQSGTVSIHKTDVLFQIGIILVTFSFPKKNRNKEVCALIVYLALTAIVLNMFGNVTDVAFRIAYYFIPPIAILIPRVSIKNRDNQKVCIMFFCLLAIRLFYFAATNGAENTVPYRSSILGM
ncbi:EpsG family protein [Fibrobacter succinogenes]|uniref:EpsG family protein n=1 Tax=Fibrobacter succinogenes TaxID=833 RepID=UPI0013D67556|nr:EpsG family protein [Fibrobacter succinogenes]